MKTYRDYMEASLRECNVPKAGIDEILDHAENDTVIINHTGGMDRLAISPNALEVCWESVKMICVAKGIVKFIP